jgi:hypothetical protein
VAAIGGTLDKSFDDLEDALMPSQFYDRRRSKHLTDEQLMMIGLIENVYREMFWYPKQRADIECWLLGARDCGIAFQFACDLLGLPMVQVRDRLLAIMRSLPDGVRVNPPRIQNRPQAVEKRVSNGNRGRYRLKRGRN